MKTQSHSQVQVQKKEKKEGVLRTPKKEGALRAPGVCATLDGFDEFWLAYPKKEAQGRAEKAYARAITAGADPATLLTGVRNWSWPDRERFIPLAATWLDDKRWLDETDTFDPVLRAVGLSPADFASDRNERLLQ